MVFRPILAASVKDPAALRYPLIASPKLDGIRCLTTVHGAVSRSLKEIPNNHIRWILDRLRVGFDGELIVGKSFQETSSAVMSKDGTPAFTYWVFDFLGAGGATTEYQGRVRALKKFVKERDYPEVRIVPTKKVCSLEELLAYEAKQLEKGYEGICLRSPEALYKFGRSTLKEQHLLKLKRFEDSEARVLGVYEQQHNQNPAKKNELGYTEHSSKKAGLVGAGTLGGFHVQDLKTKQKFDIGTGKGLTKKLRQRLWDTRARLPGLVVKYRHQPHGQKDLPRLPVWLGFRDCEVDL